MIFERLMMERGYAVSAALVVALPGDESVHFAGLLASLPFEWTVIACGMDRKDPLRAWSFYDACDALGAKGKVIPLTASDSHRALSPAVWPLLNLESFDVIVTHGTGTDDMHFEELAWHLKTNFPEKTVTKSATGEFKIDMTGPEILRKEQALDCYVARMPLNVEPERYAGPD